MPGQQGRTPRAIMMETNATTMGTRAATNVPKTRISMMRAIGIPKDSPFSRSSWDISWKVLPTVAWPVISTLKSLLPLAVSTTSSTLSMLSVESS